MRQARVESRSIPGPIGTGLSSNLFSHTTYTHTAPEELRARDTPRGRPCPASGAHLDPEPHHSLVRIAGVGLIE